VKGRHNYRPALAADLAPYPLDWNDTARFEALAKVVLACAKRLGVPLTWGGDWKRFKDFPHFELPASAALDA
jgi:peptidoglycan L-alanyl-D-glutamate endopeptidase CwlK